MNRPGRLPYPGLRAFRRDEADLFFGRESAVDRMVERLAATRFLAVLGPSGSGKSSLVRTGLLDALELGLMAAAGPRWRIAELRPAGRPIENLARALLSSAGGPGTAAPGGEELARFTGELRRGPRSVIQWCQNGNLPDRTNLLILVDQFEELFRYADYAGREEAEAFVALLLESASAEGLPIYVAMTMRSEFLGPCALIPELAERIDAGLYLTRRMTREETREAIEGPARVCGFAIEPALVNHLLNDLASFAPWEGERGVDQLQLLARRADQLPLLQHVLNRLWLLAWETNGTAPITLSGATYESLGGLSGALNAHADEVLAAIAAEHRWAAEVVFRALVSGATIATAVRRPCRCGELVALAAGDGAAVEEVIEAFRDPGCNFLVASPEGRLELETVIDISHESLIRQWGKLGEWVQAEGQAAEEYRYLEETASRWKAGHAGLLRMPYLATALAWWTREHPSAAWAGRYGGDFALALRYLEKSGRRRRSLRRAALGAAWVAGLAIVVGAPYIVIQQRQLSRLRAATRADNIGTSLMTGQGMINGQGVRKDYAQAMTAFRTAADLGSLDAEYRIGYLYEYGYGVARDYAQAMTWYRRAADRGYAIAQSNVGFLFDRGYGVKPDYAEAMTWYRKAAAQGDAAAENNIGYLYEHGSGVKQDYATAMGWYRRAADQRDSTAAFNVGYLFQHGEGVKQDYAQAMKWYREAADEGYAAAEYNIGYLFEHGQGVKADYAEAMAWYRKAADQGNVVAAARIGNFFQHGYGVKQDYAEAMVWYRKAADGGDAAAANNIGYLFGNGYGVKRDYVEAMGWYRKAAEQDDPVAAFNVAYLFEHGYGIKQDYVEAMAWYRKAAVLGDASAAFRAGYLYEQGDGIKQDHAEAMAWYRRAVALGDASAAFRVGYLYEQGRGVKQDYVAAMVWYRQAAAVQNGAAENNIGWLYEHGYGVKQDYAEAMAWYRRAAGQGDASAAFNIGYLYEQGEGVKPDAGEAIQWFQKDAALGDPDGALRVGEILARQGQHDAALAAYQQSVKLAQAALVKNPADDRAKKAIRDAAGRIGGISYDFLMQGEFPKALDAADLAIGLAPELTWIEANRADALMMLGQTYAARAIFLQHKGLRNDGSGSGRSWNEDVVGGFAALKKREYSSALMAEIEADFRDGEAAGGKP